MSQRHTKAERDAFDKAYLAERMPHVWSSDGPSRCTVCNKKYGKAAGVICKKRKKPGRWKLHCNRQWMANQYPNDVPKRDGKWILDQIQELERSTTFGASRGKLHITHKGDYYEVTNEEKWWKYSRDARRYRKLISAWWQLSASETTLALAGSYGAGHSRWDGLFTRGRNKLIKRVRDTQQHQIKEGGTTYTFYPHAHVNQQPLFKECA